MIDAAPLLSLIWNVSLAILSLVGALGALYLRSRFVPKGEFDGLATRVDAELKKQDQRLIVVEQALIHAPDKEDFERLSGQIADMRSELAELRGEQSQQNKLLATIHDHLLNG